MATPRDDISIVACEVTDEALLAAFAEQDEEFYGFAMEDAEMPTVSAVQNSDEEDHGSENEFDISTVMARVGDDDQPNVFMPNLDDERKLVQKELESGCGCPHNCYSEFSEDEMYSIRLQMTELEKPERDMLLLGKLQVCARAASAVSHARKVTATKRQRITYQYSYDHRIVCKRGFCFLHAIGEKVLKNLQSHLKDNGAIPREHGNKGRLPPNAFSFATVQHIVDFISNYARVHGLPQPAAGRGRAEAAPIYLSASEGYNTVHQKYIEACVTAGLPAAKYHAFRSIWLSCIPHIKFMTPRTDVCHYCESFRVQLRTALQESEKIRLTGEFQEHVTNAQKEREFYLACLRKAEERLHSLPEDATDPADYGHYTFDFAQQLQVPYHARQVGPLYFKVPLKVHLFGICNGATKIQVNYLFDESQSIGTNGTHAHGPNSVISMVHHFFEHHSGHEPTCHLHADNCVGQNKNRSVIGYLAWRVIMGLHQKITLSFMLVGHTRCFVDGNFGLLKKCYRSGDVDTVQQLSQIVNISSRTNTAQMYPWEWREWDKMLDNLFTPVKGIRSYQHFSFSSEKKGQVSMKCLSDGEEKTINILKRGITVRTVQRAALPRVIHPGGITRERQQYLYDKVREHVWPEFRDITCPRPT